MPDSSISTLAEALEAEHREIDEGVYAFLDGAEDGRARLDAVFEELRRHIYLEETFLFGPLREAGLMAPVFVMLREHGEMWQKLADIEDALSATTAHDPIPDSAAALCRELLTQLEAHNTKEEPILYPELRGVLPDSAQEQYVAFLDEGERPEGWECERARADAPVKPPWG